MAVENKLEMACMSTDPFSPLKPNCYRQQLVCSEGEESISLGLAADASHPRFMNTCSGDVGSQRPSPSEKSAIERLKSQAGQFRQVEAHQY